VSTAGAGWYPDPSGRHALRWYDGRQWTPHAVDGRRQPVIDPLPGQAGTTADHPGPVPGAAAAPPVPAVRIGPLVFRYAVLGVAAVLFVLGFVVLPYAGVDRPPRDFSYTPTRYPEFGPWIRELDTGMSTWGQIYSGGLAPLLAATAWLAVAATVLVVAVVPAYRTRTPWWTVLVFLLVGLCGGGAMIASPVNGTTMLNTHSGYLVVLAAHALLAVACPLGSRRR